MSNCVSLNAWYVKHYKAVSGWVLSSAENVQITVEENDISWPCDANITVITANTMYKRVLTALIVSRYGLAPTELLLSYSYTQLFVKNIHYCFV